ncbi:hypothetical protein [uncultured Variovorax sp.]|uniref:hypothetical protein n=1 Tax=uncultured Variovorax sp. TaxID=114708 RepID=UPI0025CF46F1|nr:hypothetical protein [uncultured Variovorax sp.]
MLIALTVLAVLNLVLSFVVFCGQRALWARLPAPVSVENTVGDVASAKMAAESWIAQQRNLRARPPVLTPEDQAQVAAYRASRSDAAHGLSDLEVLALARLNPA